MTRTCEIETIAKMCEALSGISGAAVKQKYDFTTAREPLEVRVGIESVEQMNFNLDDYRLDLTIAIASFCTEDPSTSALYSVKSQVDNVVRSTEALFPTFTSVFGDVPVVGFYQAADDDIRLQDDEIIVKKHINVIISY